MTQKPLKVDVEDVSVGRPIDLAWAKRADQLQLESLPTIRTSAERWAGTLTGLLGAVGIATILDGPDRFNTLSSGAETVSKAAFSVAAVLTLVGAGLAIVAAQSTSRRVLLPAAGSYREASEEAVRSATRCLTASRWLVALAVVATLVAGGCLWWGDRDESSTQRVDVRGCLATRTQGQGSVMRSPDLIVRCNNG
jgi:hypothetical protein